MLKGKFFKKDSANELWLIEKYQNHTLKVDILCQRFSESFQKKITEEYQFRTPTFVKDIF